MTTLSEILRFLIQTIASLYLFAVVLRLLLQLARADFYNPLSQFLVKITNPLLRPLRRVIPPVGRIDSASVVLALLVQLLAIVLVLAVFGVAPGNPLRLLGWSVLGIAAQLINLYFMAILALIIMSWVAPFSMHPAAVLLRQLVDPVMAPFRKLIPPIGPVDVSPIVVFLVIGVAQRLVSGLAVTLGVPPGLIQGV
jgi:YggT family protein